MSKLASEVRKIAEDYQLSMRVEFDESLIMIIEMIDVRIEKMSSIGLLKCRFRFSGFNTLPIHTYFSKVKEYYLALGYNITSDNLEFVISWN
jgi:hypothetical protein